MKYSSDISLTILYDNNVFNENLETSWGFSCFITGTDKTILFDTGSNPFFLLRNIQKLSINIKEIDLVFLSHMHWDHIGGLYAIIENNPDVCVFVLESFSKKFKENIKHLGVEIIEIKNPVKICNNVFSTGEMGISIKEQSLIVDTDEGLLIITGCAHPGVLNIIKHAKTIFKNDILMLAGGFHLENQKSIEKIVTNIRNSGIRYIAPCHCTGSFANELFEKEYGSNYIQTGLGKVIKL